MHSKGAKTKDKAKDKGILSVGPLAVTLDSPTSAGPSTPIVPSPNRGAWSFENLDRQPGQPSGASQTLAAAGPRSSASHPPQAAQQHNLAPPPRGALLPHPTPPAPPSPTRGNSSAAWASSGSSAASQEKEKEKDKDKSILRTLFRTGPKASGRSQSSGSGTTTQVERVVPNRFQASMTEGTLDAEHVHHKDHAGQDALLAGRRSCEQDDGDDSAHGVQAFGRTSAHQQRTSSGDVLGASLRRPGGTEQQLLCKQAHSGSHEDPGLGGVNSGLGEGLLGGFSDAAPRVGGGAVRTGSLMATPLAVEHRNGPAVY